MKYPGPTYQSFAGYLFKARSDPIHALFEIAERYGSVTHLRIGTRHVFLITSPGGVKHILQDNQHNYRGFTYSYKHIQPLLGNGLLTSSGETWLRHRRLAQQAFQDKKIKGLSASMVEVIEKFLARWEKQAASSHSIDIGKEMSRLTLSVVTESLFGTSIGEGAEIVKDAFPTAMHYMLGRMLNPFQLPEWLPTRKNRAYHQSLEALNTIVHRLISKGRQLSTGNPNLLGMLIAAHDSEDPIHFDDQEIRDEVMTLLLAGHETCANALTWTLYLLALHPDIQERLAGEAEIASNQNPLNCDHTDHFPFTNMVINEALRLYPPAWIMARDVIEPDVIDEWPIPSGSLVLLSPYISHHLPTLWEDPERFDPLRFSADCTNDRPRFAYFPFGGGQRQCLGKNFALLEASLAMSLMIGHYRFSIDDTGAGKNAIDQRIFPALDMHPNQPIILRLEKR